jgi:hypothetical protein
LHTSARGHRAPFSRVLYFNEIAYRITIFSALVAKTY